MNSSELRGLRQAVWAGLIVGLCSGMIGCAESGARLSIAATPPAEGAYQPLIRRVGDLVYRPLDLAQTGERHYLIRDLGTTRDPAAYGVLASILIEDLFTQHERNTAAVALATLGDARALGALEAAARAEWIDPIIRIRALGVLAVNGNNPQALTLVIRTVHHDRDPQHRAEAARALRSVNPKHVGATATLDHMVRHDPVQWVAVEAACSQVARGQDRHWPFLRRAAGSPDPQARVTLATSVPFGEESVPILLDLLGDGDVEVAGSAWEALDKNLTVPGAVGPHDGGSYDVPQQRALYRKAWEQARRTGSNT